jgi:hypothetical protein
VLHCGRGSDDKLGGDYGQEHSVALLLGVSSRHARFPPHVIIHKRPHPCTSSLHPADRRQRHIPISNPLSMGALVTSCINFTLRAVMTVDGLVGH